jgi:hypothetical protein
LFPLLPFLSLLPLFPLPSLSLQLYSSPSWHNPFLFFTYTDIDYCCYVYGLYVIQKGGANLMVLASTIALPLSKLTFAIRPIMMSRTEQFHATWCVYSECMVYIYTISTISTISIISTISTISTQYVYTYRSKTDSSNTFDKERVSGETAVGGALSYLLSAA